MGRKQDPMATPPKAKPHRCWTEVPGPAAGGRAGPEGRAWGSLHPGSCADVWGPPCSPALEVTGARSQEHVVGVPVQAEDSGANGLLDVLAHPPGHTDTQRGGGPVTSAPKASVPQELHVPMGPCRPPCPPPGSLEGGAWALLAHGPLGWITPVGCWVPSSWELYPC